MTFRRGIQAFFRKGGVLIGADFGSTQLTCFRVNTAQCIHDTNKYILIDFQRSVNWNAEIVHKALT